MDARQRAIVDAIRADPCVGRGTCSTIDECVEDEDLADCFGDQSSPQAAVAAARRYERNYIARAVEAEAEWAPAALRDFDARCAANPVVR